MKSKDQPRHDIPRGHDTRDISSRFGPDSGETFPGDSERGYDEGITAGRDDSTATSIPSDRRSNWNGSPRRR